jgi:alpha-tubulin suppressor-like RCC1 family protein
MRPLLITSVATLLLGGCSSDPNKDEPGQLILASITAGYGGTCGLNLSGTLICWGVLGDGMLPAFATEPCSGSSLECATRPVVVPTGQLFREVRTTGHSGHVCGITPQDALYCWGQMLVTMDAIATIGLTPQLFLPGKPVLTVTAGLTHDCALDDTGQAFCWGDHDYNVRGTGGPVAHSYDFIPNAVAGGFTFTAISAGTTHTCGLESGGEALCWGDPEAVGLSTAPIATECGLPSACVEAPVRVAQGRHYKAISASARATCAISTLDEVYCWGTGEANPGSAIEPVKVNLPGAVTRVQVGGDYGCAIVSGGDAYCWGRNAFGQLGNGSAVDAVLPPAKVVGGHSFAEIIAGVWHTCALDQHGGTWCWGLNDLGALGTGDFNHCLRPSPVLGILPALSD